MPTLSKKVRKIGIEHFECSTRLIYSINVQERSRSITDTTEGAAQRETHYNGLLPGHGHTYQKSQRGTIRAGEYANETAKIQTIATQTLEAGAPVLPSPPVYKPTASRPLNKRHRTTEDTEGTTIVPTPKRYHRINVPHAPTAGSEEIRLPPGNTRLLASDKRLPRSSNIQSPRSETQSPRSETQSPRSETQSPRSENQSPRSETQSPRSENRSPRSDFQLPPTADLSTASPRGKNDDNAPVTPTRKKTVRFATPQHTMATSPVPRTNHEAQRPATPAEETPLKVWITNLPPSLHREATAAESRQKGKMRRSPRATLHYHPSGGNESDTSSTSSTETALSFMSAPAVMMSGPRQPRVNDTSTAAETSHHKWCWPPNDSELLQAVKSALRWKPRQRSRPIFDFNLTRQAAANNFAILEQNDFNLERLLLNDGLSPLMPGSEFRPVALLAPLLEGHPFWPRLRRSLLIGATMDLEDISEDQRHAILDTAMDYGNHKSAATHGDKLLPSLEKEVKKGWHLPLPMDRLHEIPGIIMGPMGAVPQKSLGGNGEESTKLRMTHDQSFDYGSETTKSVNQRVLASSLSQCVYGHTLSRLAHAMVSTRWRYPHAAILIGKLDYKSAFRRLHLRAQAALQCVISTTGLMEDPVALASLRVTFGGRPSPTSFSELSEPVTDLANALLRCKAWDPKEIRPIHGTLLGKPKLEDKSVPFAPARKLIVRTRTDEFGLIDVFLDDIISVFPALSDENVDRCSLAALLAMELTSRPNSKNEPLPREEMLALDKAHAEATPAEIAIVLGWLINTRKLLMSLTDEKFENWTTEIQNMLDKANGNYRINLEDLARLLGRLQHTTFVLQEGCHFLNRIRTAKMRAEANKSTRLNKETRRDLELWKAFLAKAHRGIDINLLVAREPDYIIRTDACEHGLGGFSLTTGRAWRYGLPEDAQNQKSINYLEFLACITGIIVSLHEGEGASGDCFLSLGDNTSSLGWLRKSNFAADGHQASHSALAREFALLVAEYGVGHFSQWFPGKENEVADILSRDQVATDKQLTSHINSTYTTQVSTTFRISQLPPEIISWLDYWVRHTPASTLSPPTLTGRKKGTTATISSSSNNASSTKTPSSTDSGLPTSTRSSVPTCTQSGTKHMPRVQRDMITWLRAHAVPPSRVYERPSAQAVDPIQRWTQMENLRTFYGTNSAVAPTMTRPPANRSRSRSF